ncbi:hypothetical protein JJB09_03060 [Rhizobium sp. KVB221]|uniref:DUF6456 domain-containing protein n=1 Tax=Rhizobium setariae TaxID=2801340 RepID=A0A936YK05_9HYPH|nr:DUF6456 domain-containing protein [Rhizobium setariae]MBL0370998.1 hypothetical protein [Rhizobium setariae]
MNKEIARLLRFIGSAGCRIEARPDGKCRLARPGRGELVLAGTVIAEAATRGLVLVRDAKLFATSEARPYLRRFLAAREEAFLDQHRSIEVVRIADADGARHVRLNSSASPLAALSRLRDGTGKVWFSTDALSAGDRLAQDFQFANLQPKITPSYEPRLGNRTRAAPGAGVEMKDSVLAARLRVSRAVEAMGPELAGVALDVCCFEKGLETVERERQWPARSAKLMLKTALQQLHRHYNPAPRRTRQSHAWGDEGYRPDLVG